MSDMNTNATERPQTLPVIHATFIFKDYKAFHTFNKNTQLYINGVSEEFARKHPNYKEMNSSNTECWNLLNCTDCYRCNEGTNLSNCDVVWNSIDCISCADANHLDNCKHVICNDDLKDVSIIPVEAPKANENDGMPF